MIRRKTFLLTQLQHVFTKRNISYKNLLALKGRGFFQDIFPDTAK